MKTQQQQKQKKTSIGGIDSEVLDSLVSLKIQYQAIVKKQLSNNEFVKVLCDAMELYMK